MVGRSCPFRPTSFHACRLEGDGQSELVRFSSSTGKFHSCTQNWKWMEPTRKTNTSPLWRVPRDKRRLLGGWTPRRRRRGCSRRRWPSQVENLPFLLEIKELRYHIRKSFKDDGYKEIIQEERIFCSNPSLLSNSMFKVLITWVLFLFIKE